MSNIPGGTYIERYFDIVDVQIPYLKHEHQKAFGKNDELFANIQTDINVPTRALIHHNGIICLAISPETPGLEHGIEELKIFDSYKQSSEKVSGKKKKDAAQVFAGMPVGYFKTGNGVYHPILCPVLASFVEYQESTDPSDYVVIFSVKPDIAADNHTLISTDFKIPQGNDDLMKTYKRWLPRGYESLEMQFKVTHSIS